jgi:excisionase family DNA binding protein
MAAQTKTKSNARLIKAPVPKYADLPELCTPEQAGAFLQLSRNTCYELLRTGALPSVRFGRQIRIRKTVLIGESK